MADEVKVTEAQAADAEKPKKTRAPKAKAEDIVAAEAKAEQAPKAEKAEKAPKAAKAKAENKEENLLKITLIKSTAGALETHKRTIQALGLKKIRSFVIRPDSPALQGMLFKVKHLIKVEKA